MKAIQFVLLLCASLLLWACQPASTSTSDKSAPKISASGDPNVALDCKTGRPLTSAAPAVIGLGGASLEHVGDQAIVIFYFPRVENLAQTLESNNLPTFGGIGFIDPALSLPAANPKWYFDSSQNRGRKWSYDPGTHRFDTFYTYFKDSKRAVATEPTASAAAVGSNLIVTFPWSEVAGSVWYVSATDPTVCTALGLGADGKPNLPMPEGIAPGAPTSVAPASTATPAASNPTPVVPTPTAARPTPTPTPPLDAEEPGFEGY